MVFLWVVEKFILFDLKKAFEFKIYTLILWWIKKQIMKRRRMDLHCLQSINKDIINLINTFHHGNDFLNMLQLCKQFYFCFGGIVNIFKRAIALKDYKLLTQGARKTQNIETLLHKLQWQYLSKNSSNVSQAILHEISLDVQLCEGLDASQLKLADKTFWEKNAMITGNFVRSIIIKALKKNNISIAKNLIVNTNDSNINIFIKQVSFPIASFYSNLNQIHIDQNVNLVVIKKPNLLSNTKPIHFIQTNDDAFNIIEKEVFATLIKTFEFTCSQISIYGSYWWRKNPQILVTPAFLFSLLSGQMYFTFFAEIPKAWPFTDLENMLLQSQCSRYAISKCVIFRETKLYFYDLFLKYQRYGFKDLFINENQQLDLQKITERFRIYNDLADNCRSSFFLYNLHFHFLSFVFKTAC